MLKFTHYGPWFTVKTCPSCDEEVSRTEIYEKGCCSLCGHSDPILLEYNVTTLRRVYIRKSIIPFRSKWVYEIKDRKPRFGGGGGGGGGYTLGGGGMSLATVAACVAIM